MLESLFYPAGETSSSSTFFSFKDTWKFGWNGWKFFLGMLRRWVDESSVTVEKVYLGFAHRIFRHAHGFCMFGSILGFASCPVFVYLPPPVKIVFWLYSTGS